jgi:hypothetical protein
MLQQQPARRIAVEEARQEQRVDPHRNADQHAAHGASRGRALPEQAAEKRRRKLRDRRKRQQADRRQLGLAERAIVEIGHRHDGEDRKAARAEQEVAEILLALAVSRPRCSTSGRTMSFETMIESATHSTITIAVAADRPPTKTATLSSGAFPSIGSASTYMSLSTAPNGKVTSPASAIGITNRLIATR